MALKSSTPTAVDDGADERRTVDVLARLGLQAEQPAQQPVERVAAAAAARANRFSIAAWVGMTSATRRS